MATKIDTPTKDIITDTEYQVNEGWYSFLPSSVSGSVSYHLKQTEAQNMVADVETFNKLKVLYISKFHTFKFIFAGTGAKLTMAKCSSFKG